MTGLLYEKEQNQQHGGQRGTLGVAHILDVDNYPAYEFREGDIWLGRTTQKGFPVGFNDDTHITVVAGSRSGKGTAFIVPNLCVWEGSTVVIDPKGENATLTAARRGSGSDYCEGMGQKVCVLDPFNAAASLAEEYKGCFNPLDILDPDSETLVDDASRIAASLVISNDKGEKFFSRSSQIID
jgi:type IV secretory pathway TraG/TraD family ATPase VirD4